MSLTVARGRKGSLVEIETKKRKCGRRSPVRAHIKPKKGTYVKAHSRCTPESVVAQINRERKLPGEADFWKNVHRLNDGVFFRGVHAEPGFEELLETDGVLGHGLYVTWDEGAARAFSRTRPGEEGHPSWMVEVVVPRSLKLLDAQSDEMVAIKKKLGVGRWDRVGDRPFSFALRREVEKKGYDGVVSDDRFDGVLIFNTDKVEVKRKRRL